jgi:poly(hydroxyalkanoate) depolymerase family esterase
MRTPSSLATTVLAALALSCSAPAPSSSEAIGTTRAALEAVTGFGSNPGNLLMYRYVPATAPPPNAPLLVVLHGCEQGATDIAGAGWDTLADQYGFYVVYPQQQAANNPATCFDWFGQYQNPANKANITRDQGEDASIAQMVAKMKSDFSIDAHRVFVAGFSSGGAMAAALLATYPDVFAAGGIDAGVPYNCPSLVNNDVFTCMNPGKTQTADQWGQAVKAGDSGWAGPWPRVTIWQGTADTIVGTANEGELVKQWTNVHGIAATPTSQNTVASYPHSVFADANGVAQVEEYQITGMSHGIAIDPSNGCGTASQYLPDEHVCTAKYMLQFFGIIATPGVDGGMPGSDAAAPGDGSAPPGDGAAPSDAPAAAVDAHVPAPGPTHMPSPSPSASPSADSGAPPAPAGDGGVAAAGGSGFAGCAVGARPEGGSFAVVIAVALGLAFSKRRRNPS